MGKLTQVMAAVRRGVTWLVPAGRRDWAEAVWAEAHEVPPGLTRLAWRAGGVRAPANVRIGQGIAAGLLANGLAAMFTTMLGTGATLLMIRSPRLLHWVTHGRHLTEVAAYRYQLNTGNHAGGYLLMLMFFPVIGLFVSSLAASFANHPPYDVQPAMPMTSGE